MELLNRYLQAVGQYLPAETKEDMLDELRANLLAQMDGREEELGRGLTDVEVAAILKAHGKPEVVAVRYLPQRSLIGPTVYPFYLFTLKRALPLVILIYVAARGTVLLLSSKTGNVAVVFAMLVLQFVPVLLTFWAIVTLVFAAIERGHRQFGKGASWSEWDPEKLAPVASEVKGRTRTARVADVIAHCFGILYVAAIPHYPFLILGPGAALVDGMTASAAMHVFYFWILIVMGAQLGLKLFDMGREPRIWIEIAVKGLSVVILAFVWGAKVYFVPKFGEVDVRWLNDGFSIGCGLLLFWGVQDLVRLVWRALRGAPVMRAGVNEASVR